MSPNELHLNDGKNLYLYFILFIVDNKYNKLIIKFHWVIKCSVKL